jgi:IS30 family transposase
MLNKKCYNVLIYPNLQSISHLTMEQRYAIETYLGNEFSQNKIAQLFGTFTHLCP